MKPENRLCLWCQHLAQEEAYEWSEETRDLPSMDCSKGQWQYKIFGDILDINVDMYETFCIAKTCDEFELNECLFSIVKG